MAKKPGAASQPNRRGRPPKYGQPSQVVAVTLPHRIVATLRELHSDLGWAIVALVEKSHKIVHAARRPGEAELVQVGNGQRLIVVDSAIFRALPGVRMIPLSPTQSFLALEPGRGMADLEIAVLDRLERPVSSRLEREALGRLRDQLRRWRRHPHLRFDIRSIILVSHVSRRSGRFN